MDRSDRSFTSYDPSVGMLRQHPLSAPCLLYPVAAETRLTNNFKDIEQVRKIILMLTKLGVHSWEEGTPDNHLCVSKAQYPFLGGMDSLRI